MLHRLIRNDEWYLPIFHAWLFFHYYLIDADDVQCAARWQRRPKNILFFYMVGMVKVQISAHQTSNNIITFCYLQTNRKYILAKSKVAFLVYIFLSIFFFYNFFGLHVRLMIELKKKKNIITVNDCWSVFEW